MKYTLSFFKVKNLIVEDLTSIIIALHIIIKIQENES